MSNATIPENLRLVLEHLSAVRELERYLRKKGGVNKDVEKYTKDTIVPLVLQRLPTLASWERDIWEFGAEWYPQEWKLDNHQQDWMPDDEPYVSIYLAMPNPAEPDLEESLPSIYLWAPEEWNGLDVFRDSTPAWHAELEMAGFEHGADRKWDAAFVFGKDIHWLKADGSFDEADFIERIALAAGTIVEFEPEITQSIREASAQRPDKKRNQKQRGKKKSG